MIDVDIAAVRRRAETQLANENGVRIDRDRTASEADVAAFDVVDLLGLVASLSAERDAKSIAVDGLVYGEHMIRQLHIFIGEFTAERDAMRANYDRLVSKARQFERYPGGEGARVELRSALDALGQLDDDRKEHDWLACPDCRALSKAGHEPPRCDVFMASERAASTACDCTPTAHGHLSSCPRYRP